VLANRKDIQHSSTPTKKLTQDQPTVRENAFLIAGFINHLGQFHNPVLIEIGPYFMEKIIICNFSLTIPLTRIFHTDSSRGTADPDAETTGGRETAVETALAFGGSPEKGRDERERASQRR
jgi:hypothetical protein